MTESIHCRAHDGQTRSQLPNRRRSGSWRIRSTLRSKIKTDRLGAIHLMGWHSEQIEKASLPRRQLILFFVLAYGIAWIFFGALGLSRAGLGWIPLELSIPVMTVSGSFAPSLAALLTLRFTERRWPTTGRFGIKALLVSGAMAPFWIIAVFAVAPAVVLTTGKVAALGWNILISPSVYGISTLIGGPFGEEPGWRGFALLRLQARLGPARASFLL